MAEALCTEIGFQALDKKILDFNQLLRVAEKGDILIRSILSDKSIQALASGKMTLEIMLSDDYKLNPFQLADDLDKLSNNNLLERVSDAKYSHASQMSSNVNTFFGCRPGMKRKFNLYLNNFSLMIKCKH